jgi:electron transfer flavoprotein beta subunit
MVAELLAVPAATGLSEVTITGAGVSGVRVADGATVRISTGFPAVISITEALPDARFPNFKGIMAAKKKPFETLTLADLAVVADDPGTARSIVVDIAEKPPRAAGTKIADEGDAGDRLAQYLLDNRLA